MSIFKTLFSGGNLVDKAADGIDATFYTDEEKSTHFATLLKLYEPFKVAQRFLAVIFSVPYALFWLVTGIASFWRDVTPQVDLLTNPDGIAPIVLMINIFYFGGGALEGVVRRFRTKKEPE